VVYNRRALKVYITKARLKTTLVVKYYILKQYIYHVNDVTGTMIKLSKGKCILNGDGTFTENVQRSADAVCSYDAPG
jgi:hypothetical protein